MPGIYGLLLSAPSPRGNEIAQRLARLSAIFPWEETTTVEVVPGRLFIGSISRGSRTCGDAAGFCRDGELTCAVDGFLGRMHGYGEAGALVARQEFAAAACAAYRAHGAQFPAHLEGQFSVLLHDAGQRRLIAGNGRYGFAPLHMRHEDGAWVVSSLLGPVAACGLFEPEVDAGAVTGFLSHGQYMGTRTAIRGIELLPAAATVEIPLDGGAPQQRRHWDFGQIGSGRDREHFRFQIDAVCEAFRAATSRIARRAPRIASGLSGGFDSRLVTALFARELSGVKAWTFGGGSSTDLPSARAVSRRLGIEHLIYPLDPETIPAFAEDFVTTTSGGMTVNLAFGRARRADLRERADLVLNGNAGDAILGGSMLGPRSSDIAAWARYRLGRGPRVASPWLEANRNEADIALFLDAKYGHGTRLATLVSPRAPTLREIVRDELMSEPLEMSPARWVEQWIFRNRVRRWTILGILSDRPFYADDSPFYDHDVFEQCLAIPPQWRRGHRAYLRVMKRLVPDVLDIVSGNTGLAASTPGWQITLRKTSRRLFRQSRVASTGADFDAWARGELRDFYGDLLGSASVLSRPFWDGRALRALFDAHQKGDLNCGDELGLIAAAELFLRRWVDAGGARAASAPTNAERV